jgi:uncharacterized membrane protein
MRTFLLGTVALTATLALGTPPAVAADAPVVTTTLLAPGSANSYAGAVDDPGQVLVTADDGTFLRDRDGTSHLILPPAGVDAIQPNGLNDRGDILATTFFPPYKTYLRRGGTWKFIADGSGSGLNERGQVLVTVDNADGYQGSLLLWTDGKLQKITAPGVSGDTFLSGARLNEAGQVAFSQRSWPANESIGAFLWTSGSYRRLQPLAPGVAVEVAGLNDLGAVVGASADAADQNEYAVVWPRSASKGGSAPATRLAVPPGAGDLTGSAGDINNLGQIVGVSVPAGSGVPQALMWRGATAPATALLPGTYATPTDITDLGQVLLDTFRQSSTGGVERRFQAWKGGRVADLGAGVAIDQNRLGQVTGNLSTGPRNGPVTGALFTIHW